MALLEDIAKGATPGGLVVGIGAVLLAPVLVPAVTQVLRPAAKAMLRTGITAYRSVAEPISAAIGNLVAEAQVELATAGTTSASPVAEPAVTEVHKPRSRHRAGTHH